MTFAATDTPAIEIDSRAVSDSGLARLSSDALGLGFKRVCVTTSGDDPARVRALVASGIGRLPRTLLVCDAHSISGVARAGRAVVRIDSGDDLALAAARRADAGALIATTPEGLARSHRWATSHGGDSAPRLAFDLSGAPGELGLLTGLGDVSALRVWDDIASSRLLREHPCYSYLCSERACHVARSPWPRRLVIDAAATLRPYGLPVQYALGSVAADGDGLPQILASLDEAPGWGHFRGLVRRALHAFVTVAGLRLLSVDAALHDAERWRQC